jgi:hypothetical protein
MSWVWNTFNDIAFIVIVIIVVVVVIITVYTTVNLFYWITWKSNILDLSQNYIIFKLYVSRININTLKLTDCI